MNNTPENPQDFDFSWINGLTSLLYEFGKAVTKAVIVLEETISPLFKKIEESKPQLVEIGQAIGSFFSQIAAIKKLGDAQFVYWDSMRTEFVAEINNTDNINRLLRGHFVRDNLKKVNDTINKTLGCKRMCMRKRLYMQAVDAFHKNNCDLAVVGFTAVFDGLLSDVTDNSMTNIIGRIQIIEKKFENKEPINDNEYAIMTLASTLYNTILSFAANSDFNKPEPKTLNRHWIAHGRSTRKKTKLDCVKMINLIYGLLIVSDLKPNELLYIENNYGA